MLNDSMKMIRDQLTLASKLVFQTADTSFVGRNVINDIENGDIFNHAANMPLTKVDNTGHDIVGLQNFAVMWKSLGNEINGISEAMLGVAPKSGTAWRQTEALLQESYSLFELMTENKGLAIEAMMREWIIPYLKTKMDTSEEVAATLSEFDITRIDSMYIKAEGVRQYNRKMAKRLITGDIPGPDEQQAMLASTQNDIRETLGGLGNQRFFKPDDLSDKTWKEQFKDLEWECEVDVTDENQDVKDALTTLNTALRLVLTPGFDQNPKAKAIVGRVLELTGAMSPVEYNAIPSAPPPPAAPGQPSSSAAPPALPVGGAPLAQ
jgi:hypothetical protein